MKYYFLMLLSILIIACNSNTSVDKQPVPTVICKCNNNLSPLIEIWSHTGGKYVIGDWGNKKDEYSKSNGWNLTDYPFPKIFDLKFTLINNLILYDNPSPLPQTTFLSVNMKLRVSESEDATYSLNSQIVENIPLIKNRNITDADFKQEISKDHMDIWIKNIPFEALYSKYKKSGLHINQLIFYIKLNSDKSCCNYEYTFKMAGQGEP